MATRTKLGFASWACRDGSALYNAQTYYTSSKHDGWCCSVQSGGLCRPTAIHRRQNAESCPNRQQWSQASPTLQLSYLQLVAYCHYNSPIAIMPPLLQSVGLVCLRLAAQPTGVPSSHPPSRQSHTPATAAENLQVNDGWSQCCPLGSFVVGADRTALWCVSSTRAGAQAGLEADRTAQSCP